MKIYLLNQSLKQFDKFITSDKIAFEISLATLLDLLNTF